MWKAVFAVGMMVALSACQSSKTHILERGRPFKLTSDELSDIHQSVIWHLNRSHYIHSTNSDSIKFGKIAAARNAHQASHGLAALCGFIRVKQSDGTYSDEKLFMGTFSGYPSRLHNDRASVIVVSKEEEGKAHVLARCREMGIEL